MSELPSGLHRGSSRGGHLHRGSGHLHLCHRGRGSLRLCHHGGSTARIIIMIIMVMMVIMVMVFMRCFWVIGILLATCHSHGQQHEEQAQEEELQRLHDEMRWSC